MADPIVPQGGERIPANHRLAERQLIALVHEGQWEIDEQGRIWRVALRTGRKGGGSHVVPVGRRRAEKQLPGGYLMVRAMLGGKRVCGVAHRLVWQHFFGDIPAGHQVNHLNGIKNDNRPENLQTATASENLKRAHEGGLLDQSGEKNPAAKLSNREVAQIRLAYAQGGYTMEQLGERFGVSYQTVSKLVRGERRRGQGGPVSEQDHRHLATERDPATGRFVSANGGLL